MESSTGRLWEPSFVHQKEVIWEIPNVLKMPQETSYWVKSPEFCFANTTCYLEMNPKPDEDVKGNNFGVYLMIMYPNPDNDDDNNIMISKPSVIEDRIDVSFYVVNSEGNKNGSHSFRYVYDVTVEDTYAYVYIPCYTLKRSKLIKQKHLLLPNGTLTLCFEMRVVKDEAIPEAPSHPRERRSELPPTELHDASSQTEVLESVPQAEAEEASTSVQRLQVDYNKLLKSEEDSDVCLKVSEKEFRAHKCILRARSTVFSAMFKHETKEKASGEVVIEDLDPDAFPDFLQHVYAGRVENLTDENVFSLYSAADKYDLQELKSECRAYMGRTLSVDTFCDVVTLALKYREDELLKVAVEFFCKNLTKIIVTVKWQKFTKEHNTESNELFIKALVPGAQKESS